MAVPRTIETNGRIYTAVEDLVIRYRLVVAGVIRDRIRAQPLRAPFGVTVDRPGLRTKVLEDGLFAVSGYTEEVFPDLPGEPPGGYPFELTFRASGYREITLPLQARHDPGFPLPQLSVDIEPLPVRLRGRVFRRASPSVGLGGAVVRVVTPRTVGLRTPLSSPHAVSSPVRAVALAGVGATRHLEAPAVAGAGTVVLSDRSDVDVGRLLRLGDPRSYELAAVAVLPADTDPGPVRLKQPLGRSHRRLAEVEVLEYAASGPTRVLTREGRPGDALLALDGDLVGEAVRIEEEASSTAEYSMLNAVTDREGYYSIEGVAGLGQVELRPEAGVGLVYLPSGVSEPPSVPPGWSSSDPLPEPPPLEWLVEYWNPVNVVDFLMVADVRLSP